MPESRAQCSATAAYFRETVIDAPAQRFGKFLLFDRISGEGRRETRRARAALRGFAVHLTRLEIGAAELTHFFPVFVEEMSRAGFLFHRAIQQCYEFGQIDGVPFYTGENIEGLSVATLLAECRRQRVPLPVPAALHIASEVAAALTYAEGRRWGTAEGLVHSAVGPHEIFVTDLGEVKLGGFGVYRALNRVALSRPFLDELSTDFLAPEGLLRQVDSRADVYGCVALLYGLLTFRAPRESALHGRPPPPSSLRARIRPELDALCALGLADDPGSRAFTAEELERELSDLLSEEAPSFEASDLGQFLVGLRDGTLGRALENKRRARDAHNRRDTMSFGGADLDVELTQAQTKRPSTPVLGVIPIAMTDTDPADATVVDPPPAPPVVPPPHSPSAAAQLASPRPNGVSDPRAPVTLSPPALDPALAAITRPAFAAGTAERSYAWIAWVVVVVVVLAGAAATWFYLDGPAEKPAVTAMSEKRTPTSSALPAVGKPAAQPQVADAGIARSTPAEPATKTAAGPPEPPARNAAPAVTPSPKAPPKDDPFPAEADAVDPPPPSLPRKVRPAPQPTKRPAVWASLGRGPDEVVPAAPDGESPAPSAPAAERPADSEPPPATAEPGFLSLTSELWARVTVDGQQSWTTPIVKRALPPGKHTLKLYNPDNQLTQILVIRIRSGQTLERHVTWGKP